MTDQPSLLGGEPEQPPPKKRKGLDTRPLSHARSTDVDTSHIAAAHVRVTAQARRILRSYAAGAALLDVEAYNLAGYPMTNNRGQRCSDLRHAGYIERTGNKRITPNGSPAHECRITEDGRRFLTQLPRKATR